jgi:hypothetical protein
MNAKRKVSDQEWLENPNREFPAAIPEALAEVIERLCGRIDRRERLLQEGEIEIWRKVG